MSQASPYLCQAIIDAHILTNDHWCTHTDKRSLMHTYRQTITDAHILTNDHWCTHTDKRNRAWQHNTNEARQKHRATNLSSAMGVKRRHMMACMPGICGMIVVSRAMMVRPSGLRLRKADTIMRTNLFCGSTSMAAELTLSGSTRTLLEVRRIVVSARFQVKSSAAQKTEMPRGLTQVLAKSGLKTNTESEAKKIIVFFHSSYCKVRP